MRTGKPCKIELVQSTHLHIVNEMLDNYVWVGLRIKMRTRVGQIETSTSRAAWKRALRHQIQRAHL